jgi:Helix-turn-helix domain
MASPYAECSVRIDDAYLPLVALSKYGGLSIRTLRSYLTDRTHPLPHFRVGGKILVRRSDFDAWATQFKVSQAAVPVDTLVDDVVGAMR